MFYLNSIESKSGKNSFLVVFKIFSVKDGGISVNTEKVSESKQVFFK